jgi:predicted HicB family RNase H-like nuclease
MKYKDYTARIEFDEQSRIFHGEVLGLRDVITFEGKSVQELERALKDSINDYLSWCEEEGEEPEKPYSGKFVMRVSPEIHRQLALEAGRQNRSLNALVGNILGGWVKAPPYRHPRRKNHESAKAQRRSAKGF